VKATSLINERIFEEMAESLEYFDSEKALELTEAALKTGIDPVDIIERAKEIVREKLRDHQVEQLDDDIASRLEEIVREAERLSTNQGVV
jgi:hypothetical protein